MKPAITVNNVTLRYEIPSLSRVLRRRSLETVLALSGVTFSVNRGETVGVIGRNGAGKSTLLRVLAGTLDPDEGNVEINGRVSTLLALGSGFNHELSGRRNIMLGCLAAGMTRHQAQEVEQSIIDYAELHDAIEWPLKTYSSGMSARLAFAITLSMDPDILLVDEVFSVGDESFREKSTESMRELLAKAGSLVLVSHQLRTLEETCTKVLWMEHGQVQAFGEPHETVEAYRLEVRKSRNSAASGGIIPPTPETRATRARAVLRRDELPKYVPMAWPRARPSIMRRAQQVVEEGWPLDHAVVPTGAPIDWDPEGITRSELGRLHSLAWLDRTLEAHRYTPDYQLLRPALDAALSWVRFGSEIAESRDERVVGARAYRLAYLVSAAAHERQVTVYEFEKLLDSAIEHADALAAEGAFQAHSNHGLYQAAGLHALTSMLGYAVPDIGRYRDIAEERLVSMLVNQFTSEGVHREHSAEYHYAMLGILVALTKSGSVKDPRLSDLRDKAESALAWMIMPDGALPPIGDTQPRVVVPPEPMSDNQLQTANRRYRAPDLLAVATHGREGGDPPQGLRAFPESGYVIARSGGNDGSFLMLNAAFHSRIHKHADDLSFIWFDSGRLILSDGARFGYERGDDDSASNDQWYGDPRRVYVESTRAHNTVEIDDEDHDRSRDPYGSAVTGWSDESVMTMSGRVSHGPVTHTRSLVFAPGQWLAVIDRVSGRPKSTHTFRQRFLAHPDLTLDREDGSVVLSNGEGPRVRSAQLDTAEMFAARGEESPQLDGWLSPTDGELVPTWTFGWESEGATARFVTVFGVGDAPITGEDDGESTIRFRVGAQEVTIVLEDDRVARVDWTQDAHAPA